MESDIPAKKEDPYTNYLQTKRKVDDIIEKSDSTENNSFSKTIEISKSSSIVISTSIWQNKHRLDIRTYIKTDSYTGPLKKGINVPIEKISEIISALNEIKEQIQQNEKPI